MQEVSKLSQLSRSLAGSTDMAVVCEAGAQALLDAAGGEAARVAVLDPAGAFIVWAAVGASSDWLGEARIVAGGGLAGRAAQERRLLMLREGQLLDESGKAVGRIASAPDLTSIAVPLLVGDRTLGVAQIVGAPADVDAAAAADAIAGLLSVAVDRARLYEQARFEHAMDRTTGLWNYADFRQRLSEEIERAQRHQTALSLLRVDVDGFQELNAQFGHRAADGILSDLATIVRASLRATDVAARVGPDEFALILPETGAEGARVAASNLCDSIRRQALAADDKTVQVTVSCGAVEMGKDDADEDVFRAAGEALSQAKQSGGDTVTVAGG